MSAEAASFRTGAQPLAFNRRAAAPRAPAAPGTRLRQRRFRAKESFGTYARFARALRRAPATRQALDGAVDGGGAHCWKSGVITRFQKWAVKPRQASVFAGKNERNRSRN